MNDIEFDLEDRGIVIECGQALDQLRPDSYIKEKIHLSVIERNPSQSTSRNLSKSQIGE